jgi:hypothetical protein
MQRPIATRLVSQADLVSALTAIFPAFARAWDADNEADEFRSDSQHSVYMTFLPFVSRAQTDAKQLTRLAWLLSDAVAAGGDAENAVDTCFFEALGRRDDLARQLGPLLDPAARAYLR